MLVIRGGTIVADSPWHVLQHSTNLPELQHPSSTTPQPSTPVASPGSIGALRFKEGLGEDPDRDTMLRSYNPYETALSSFSLDCSMASHDNPLFEAEEAVDMSAGHPCEVVGSAAPGNGAVGIESMQADLGMEERASQVRNSESQVDTSVAELGGITQVTDGSSSEKAKEAATTDDDIRYAASSAFPIRAT